MNRRAFPLGTFAIFFVLIALTILSILLLSPDQKKIPPDVMSVLQRSAVPLRPFTLTSHNGVLTTEQILKGSWSFLYFGYTHCIDTCSSTVSLLSELHREFQNPANKAPPPQVFFITLDPDNDTPEAMANYLKLYQSPITGLSGFRSEIHQLATQLGIEHGMETDPVDPGLNDHDDVIFLVGPQARLIAVFHQPFRKTTIVNQFLTIRDAYQFKRD